jgi:hypothetical protein
MAAPALAQDQTYRDPSLGFSIAYPAGWTVDAHYARDLSPPIHGVAFTVPASFTAGTNLGSDTRLSVEHVAGPCSASRFLDAAVDEHSVTEDGRTWSVATASDAGAGNRYEETVHAVARGETCFGIHTFIHYAAIENFDPGTVRAFDRAALGNIFDRMRRSFAD